MPDNYAYTCSYVPLEIIHAAGFIPLRLSGSPDCCRQEETDLSRNICPYAHAILNDYRARQDEIAGVVVTDSCDAMKKVFDVLQLGGAAVHIVSVPRKITEGAERFFARQLQELYRRLCETAGTRPEPRRVEDSTALYREMREHLNFCRGNGVFPDYAEYFAFRQEIFHSDPADAVKQLRKMRTTVSSGQFSEEGSLVEHRGGGIPIITTGSPMPGKGIFSVIEQSGFSIVENDSCLDARWEPSGNNITATDEDPFGYLSLLYLHKTPCARMEGRKRELEKMEAHYPEKVRGFIHFRMPFCDLYGFDLVHMLGSTGKQVVLPLETDGSAQSEGQIRTRVQAFSEILSAEMIAGGDYTENQENIVNRNGNLFCGIDIGSTTVDGVILNEEGKILSYRIMKTGPGAEQAAWRMYKEMLKELSAKENSVAFITATGYGRDSLAFAGGTVTEITCHARGIRHLLPETRFVVDIGGQDSKVIKIDDTGNVSDFQMNDKCAAGTGRFLEVMAGALEVDLPMMSTLFRKKGETVPISSVCTVFAESEVISLLGKGHKPPAIVKGIYTSITNRLEGMIRRVGLDTPAAVTGGGALNDGLVEHLETRLGTRFTSPETPQIVGAVGAALFGMDKN